MRVTIVSYRSMPKSTGEDKEVIRRITDASYGPDFIAQVNKNLSDFIEEEPFEQLRKNKKKIRSIIHIICCFVDWNNLNGLKMLLLYAWNHPAFIRMTSAIISAPNLGAAYPTIKTTLAELGKWTIQTFGSKIELRPLYTALVRQNKGLFSYLQELRLGYMVKPRDLVRMVDVTSSCPEDIDFVKTIIIRLGLSHPSISWLLNDCKLIERSLKVQNVHLIRMLRYKCDISLTQYITPDVLKLTIQRYERWELLTRDELLDFIWLIHRCGIKVPDQALLDAAIEEYKTKFYIFTLVNRDKRARDMIPDDIFYEIASKFF